jgi:hypothetical protein
MKQNTSKNIKTGVTVKPDSFHIVDGVNRVITFKYL